MLTQTRSDSVGRRSSPCGKSCHADRNSALAALVGHYLTFRDAGLRAYPCKTCWAWHLGHPSYVPPRARQEQVWRAVDAANVPAATANPFLAGLRQRAAAVSGRLCRQFGGDADELVGVVTGEPALPGVSSRLTAAQCEDVLVACEAVELRRERLSKT